MKETGSRGGFFFFVFLVGIVKEEKKSKKILFEVGSCFFSFSLLICMYGYVCTYVCIVISDVSMIGSHQDVLLGLA